MFFDNYFSFIDHLTELGDIEFRATDTIWENKKRDCPIIAADDMKKRPRGTYDYYFEEESGILFVRWMDNKCPVLVTNYDSIEPLAKANRFAKGGKKIAVDQPNLFRSYNLFMGGVDLHDCWHQNIK